MKLTINATEINVTNAYAFQHPNGKRELRITVPQAEIGYAELKELLKGDKGEIVLTKDDGSTEAFLGYHTTATITDKVENDVEVFYVVLDCVGEAERKALEAEYKAKEAEAQAQALAQLVEQQTQALATLNEQNTQQKQELDALTEQNTELQEQVVTQSAVMDELLTEILPSLMGE